MLRHGGRHRVVERGHHLIAHLDQRDGRTGMHKVFGHLQADETASDDHRAAHVAARHVGLDTVGVGHVTQREDAFLVDAFQGRAHRVGTGRKQQAVVSLGIRAPVGCPHTEGMGLRVEADGLVPDADIDAIAPAERLGRLKKQALALGDDAADIIR